ncbi:MAG: IS481 family transposase [Blastocatellia bacterium]|nr:IS481 family transposase [Blastocatellia bacterium]
MDRKTQFIADYLRQALSLTELCVRYDISRKTAYKWIARYQQEGASGLNDRSRRPHHSPAQTSETLRQALLEARRRHPTWGADKLLALLKAQEATVAWPSRRTVCDLLSREGLIRQRVGTRKRGHPGPPTLQATAPNQLWCVDFKGQFLTRDGKYCYPLTITDRYSRYLLACHAMPRISSQETQAVFTDLFQHYGLPQAIRSDNGVPFASCALGRLSRLSVWWLQLGIQPDLIEPGKPQQNGQHERMHRVLKAETTEPVGAHLTDQQRLFDLFQQEYNEVRPHQGIGLQTPASLYHPSERPLPPIVPAFTYPTHFVTRLVSKNGGIRWNSQWVAVTTTCAGLHVGLEEILHNEWDVWLGPKKLGRLLAEQLRIEDDLGRLRRKSV